MTHSTQLIPLEGKRFGKLQVVSRADNHPNGRPRWLCLCDCGNKGEVDGQALRGGNTRSCGCQRGEANKLRGYVPPDMRCQYRMLRGAKKYADNLGLDFDLTLEDIVIPARCPYLGIEIKQNKGADGPNPNSPTLDRIDRSKGYVKSNLCVISYKAHRIKKTTTLSELEGMVEAWKSALQS